MIVNILLGFIIFDLLVITFMLYAIGKIIDERLK
jgi:succinate-acetate transporter protein|tara:strand:+ start:2723 stop:2824 length:102 start_codon:yes stop_codon:yes gene_type:complete